MTPADQAFQRAQSGDSEGFADWVRCVELSLRASLRSFARRVDVEAVVQEGLLRMWILAPTLSLEGEDAALRYALRTVRNLALREAERNGKMEPLDTGVLEEGSAGVARTDPPSDPGLRAAIRECLSRLPRKPREALRARVECGGDAPDRALALGLRMSLNTFLQNVVRARRHLARCLQRKGIALQEFLP